MSNHSFKRSTRVAQSIREVLAPALRERISDPRLKGVLITDVEVSDDVRHARVYWYFLKPDETRILEAEDAFEKASRMLRSLVGRELRMKRIPDLRFTYDRRIDHQRHMDSLLDELEIPPDTTSDDTSDPTLE